MASLTSSIPLVALALSIGSLGTLAPKFLLSTPCPSAGDGDAALHAPLFAALCVFLASTLCLLVPLRAALQGGQPLPSPAALLARARPLLAPAAAAAIGTVLQLASLLLLPAAVLAGLRGLFILWTAQLSQRLALKDAPGSAAEWRCIYACCAGALCVGAGAVAAAAAGGGGGGGDGEGGSAATVALLGGAGGAAAVGVLLSALGYAAASAQVALEQVLLDGSYSRWEVLGGEGALSALLTLGALGALQAAYAAQAPAGARSGQGLWGSLDVPAHTLACAASAPAVPAWAAAYGAVGLTFNALLLTLAQAVGPNMRVLVFTARGVLTWGVEVALYYAGGALGVRGTPLTPYSALELAGFGALVWGGALRAQLVSEREAAGKGSGGGGGGGAGGAGAGAEAGAAEEGGAGSSSSSSEEEGLGERLLK